MKRTLSLGLLMGLCGACGTYPLNQQNDAGSASRTGDKIRFLGRVNENATGGTELAWPGTGVVTAFSGKSLKVNMTVSDPTDINEIQVVLDGNTQANAVTVKQGTTQFTVTADSDGVHDLQLIKRTEVSNGKLLFKGFDPASSLVATPAPSSRFIEFIGDSITAGYGVLGTSVNCPHVGAKIANPDLEDAYDAYGWVTARALNADVSLVAISGRGVFINNDGSPGTQPDEPTMPTVWKRIDPDDTTDTYTFSRQADVVVINLATNDFSYYDNNKKSAPPQDGFVSAYVNLVKDVRKKYPKAQIILALGPMLYNDTSTGVNMVGIAQTYIKAVVSQLGDSHVSTIQFPANSTNVGCDYHPNVTSQANMASALEAQIKQVTGWQ